MHHATGAHRRLPTPGGDGTACDVLHSNADAPPTAGWWLVDVCYYGSPRLSSPAPPGVLRDGFGDRLKSEREQPDGQDTPRTPWGLAYAKHFSPRSVSDQCQCGYGGCAHAGRGGVWYDGVHLAPWGVVSRG